MLLLLLLCEYEDPQEQQKLKLLLFVSHGAMFRAVSFQILVCLNFCCAIFCQIPPPEIYLVTPYVEVRLEKNFSNFTDNSEDLILSCRASYPIKWTMGAVNLTQPVPYILSGRRQFTDFLDNSTYRYEQIVRVFIEDISMVSGTLTCRYVEMPNLHKTIELKYIPDTDKVLIESVNADSSGKSHWVNCPFQFRIHINSITGDIGLQCEKNGEQLNTASVSSRSFTTDSTLELYSNNIVRNSHCVQNHYEMSQCDTCDIFFHNSAESRILFCSENHTTAGVVIFPDLDEINQTKQHSLKLEKPREYLNEVVHLQFIKHPHYFVGEQVVVTLNWHKCKYYFTEGDLYVTLQKDGVQIRNESINYKEFKNWTNAGFSNSTLTLSPEITTFKENGTFVLALYVPLWNSSEWISDTAEFAVKVPEKPNFSEEFEYRTFYVGQIHENLLCDPKGDPEPTSFIWTKDGKAKIWSRNKTLDFALIHEEIGGKYTCTVQNRLGHKATKDFRVVIQEKDPTGVYVIVTILLVAVIFIGFFIRLCRQNKRLRMVIPPSVVKDFKDGSGPGEGNQLQIISNLPYNKKYEVQREKIIICKSAVLGSGEFGLVFKGGFVSTKNLKIVDAAVKTVKPNPNITQIKSILNELKVLTYLDNAHPNVLNILGANTSRLCHGEIFVCVELCEDSLLNILCKARNSSTSDTGNPELTLQTPTSAEFTDYANVEVPGLSPDVLILMRWAYQITDGMEFLHTKHVIHGDLAARNILISKHSQVKIADFGLGRVMENYQYFTIKEVVPLPWKWMAIETLVDQKFSTASDVWAFGVTLWEIFSLGENPYPGFQWSSNFVQDLKHGMRLECPEFGSDELYAQMIKCWDPNPANRPNFSKIKSEIASKLGLDTSGYLILDFPIDSAEESKDAAVGPNQ